MLHNDAFPAILRLKMVHCMSSGLAATRSVFELTHFAGSFSAKKSRGDGHSKYSPGEHHQPSTALNGASVRSKLQWPWRRHILYHSMLGETLLLPRIDVPTKIPTRIQDSNYLLYKEPSKQTVLHITKLLFCVHHSDQSPDRLPFWEPFGSSILIQVLVRSSSRAESPVS